MKIFTILAVALSASVFGQNVVFEDVDLKNNILKAYPAIDKNKDKEISHEEAKEVPSIRNLANYPNITSAVGIEAFVNLKELNLGQLRFLKTIDVSALKKLETLNLKENQLEGTLDVSMLPNLRILELSKNQLSQVLLPKQNNLNTVYINDNQLTSIDVSGLGGLQRLFLVNNKISSLNLSDNTALQRLHLDRNQLSTLDISGLDKLQWMSVVSNQLTSMTFRNNPALKTILARENQLQSFDFQDGTKNAFTIINVTGNPNFTSINKDCEDTLPAMDASIGIQDNCNLSVSDANAQSVSISPNPTTDFVLVKGISAKAYSIYSAEGTLVSKGIINNGKIDFQALPKGIYLLKIGDRVEKIIKK